MLGRKFSALETAKDCKGVESILPIIESQERRNPMKKNKADPDPSKASKNGNL
jgi:hypothetical protein